MTAKEAVLTHFETRWPQFYGRFIEGLPEGQPHADVRSPFRTEQKPSFRIDFEGKYAGRWIDFGTQEKGDPFSFYARIHHLDEKKDFVDIVHRIGAEFGIALPANGKSKPSTKPHSPEAVLLKFQKELEGSPVNHDLTQRRGLNTEVIVRFELGVCRNQLVFPVRDPQKRILGFKIHKGPHLKPDGTKAAKGEGIKAQLYPSSIEFADLIWIVGGEPDVWRLAVEGVEAVCSITGENSWRQEWTTLYKDRDVVIAFDCDDTGREAQRKVVKALKGVARRLRCVEWPKGLPKGYDLTDWLQAGKSLAELPLKEIKVSKVSLNEAKETISQWLYLDAGEDVVVDVILGTMVANRFQGDPVWLFIVGPPGSIKTEILRTLSEWRESYMLSTLTASTLISGYVSRSGEDPSLLPKLNGLVLIIKDFTAILDLPREARQQILGDLRDAYDGQMAKAFGSEAGTRSYVSKFGLLAAVTPAIDRQWAVAQQLGERFLKMRIPATDTRGRIQRALANSGREDRMREALSAAMEGVLLGCDVGEESAIKVSAVILDSLIDLADCLAVLRSAVSRDGYSKVVEYTPEPEVGTRLVKQFTKLARGIAAVRAKTCVEDEEFRLVRRIARETLPSKRCALVRMMYNLCDRGFLSTQAIADAMDFPTESIKLALEDLHLLGVVDRQGTGRFEWQMLAKFKDRLESLDFFELSRDEMSVGVDVLHTNAETEQLNANTTPPDISSPQIADEPISRDEMSVRVDIIHTNVDTEQLNANTIPPDISSPQSGDRVSGDEMSGGNGSPSRETTII